MFKLPSIVDLEITARCNFNCGFCFGPKNIGIKDLSFEFWKNVILFLKENGVRGVVYSGGEPTLFEKFKELVVYTKEQGLSIIVSTNASIENKIYEVASYCDWISVPYDGDCKKEIMKGHIVPISKVIEISRNLKKINPNLKIKLGSVATKENIKPLINFAVDFAKIEDEIFDTWKIYQYSPRRSSMHLKHLYEILDTKFNDLEKEIKKINLKKQKNIVFSSNSLRKASYLFIYSNGDVIIPNIGKDMTDLKLGNLDTDNFKINNKELININLKNHYNNFNDSYNLK